MDSANVFAGIPEELPGEEFKVLLDAGYFVMERIVSRGHSTPSGQWYDQEQNEWVLLLAGAAALRLEGRLDLIVMRPGDHLLLPAHCRHRVEWTDPDTDTVWLALHYGVACAVAGLPGNSKERT